MKRAENQPVGELTLYAGIFCKLWTVVDRGTVLPQHSHEYPHISLIVSGKTHVWRDEDYLGVFTAPATIRIPAHTFHKFETITDNVVIACIHNVDHADPDGEPSIAEHHNLVLED
jgi:quercetin dioxygenase-like cupin family protein